jgi:hypothetical protein
MRHRAKANYRYIKQGEDGSMMYVNGGMAGYPGKTKSVFICTAPEVLLRALVLSQRFTAVT